MCGRFTLVSPQRAAAELFGEAGGETSSLPPRYNITPSQDVLTLRPSNEGSTREAVLLRWGLVPFWAKNAAIGNRLINARAETVADKPSFRAAFRQRRCLIAADGFFEWRHEGNAKTPYHIHMAAADPFAMAGLWERWAPDGEAAVESCTIITTAANALVEPIHARMPVIVDRHDHDLWLSGTGSEELAGLLRPYPAERMAAHSVSRAVNDPRNDGPECVRPNGPGHLFKDA